MFIQRIKMAKQNYESTGDRFWRVRWILISSLLLFALLVSCNNTNTNPAGNETVTEKNVSGKDTETAATPEPTEEVYTEEEFDPLPPGQKYGKISVSKDKKTIYVHNWVNIYKLSDHRTKKAEKIVFCKDACILYEENEGDRNFSYEPRLHDAPLVKKIVVEEGNPFLYAKDGMVIKRKGADQYTDGDLLIFCAPRKKGDVRVPEGVKDIGRFAFFGCSGITSVRLPASLEVVYEACFSDMKSCTSVQADKKGKIFYTKDGVLYRRDFLDYTAVIAYPAGKKSRIYTAPEDTWQISGGAFLGADHLREVCLPSGVQKIYDAAFQRCKNLRKVIVKNKKRIPYVGDDAFDDCPKLKKYVKDKDNL